MEKLEITPDICCQRVQLNNLIKIMSYLLVHLKSLIIFQGIMASYLMLTLMRRPSNNLKARVLEIQLSNKILLKTNVLDSQVIKVINQHQLLMTEEI